MSDKSNHSISEFKNNWLIYGIIIALSGLFFFLASQISPEMYRVFKVMRTPYRGGISLLEFNTQTMKVLIANYLLVTVFGYSLLLRFYARVTQVSFLTKFLSAFFIGYICATGLIRVISLFVPYKNIYGPVVSMMLIFILLMGIPHCAGWSQRLLSTVKTFFKTKRHWLRLVCEVLFYGVMGYLLLMIAVFQADFYWVGHGPDQYAYKLHLWVQEGRAFFPIIAGHYDELLFHFFMTSQVKEFIWQIYPMWMTLGINKVSMMAMMYLVLRSFKVSSLMAWTSTLFMFIGTSSLQPHKYFMLFDSSSPLFSTTHSGRIVGIPLVMFLLLVQTWQTADKKMISGVFIVLCCFGLVTTTISNMMWLLILLVGAVLAGYYRNKYRDLKVV